MLKKSEISLSPSAIPYRRSVGDCQSSVPLYGEETFGPQQLQLFKKNIESSFLLHEVYEVISGKPDIASLEQRVPKLEQEVRTTHYLSTQHSLTELCALVTPIYELSKPILGFLRQHCHAASHELGARNSFTRRNAQLHGFHRAMDTPPATTYVKDSAKVPRWL